MAPIAIVIVSVLFLPAYFIHAVWRAREASRLEWMLAAASGGAYLLYLFVAGRWDWLGYALRYVLPCLFAVAATRGFLRGRALPWRREDRRGELRQVLPSAFVLLLFVAFLTVALLGRRHPDAAVSLTLPLRDGTFYVGQGGSTVLVNYHRTYEPQRYALDILQLGRWGRRAVGLYPKTLERYAIFDAAVHSPCTGTIAEAVDGLADNIPPQRDPDHAAGNHVVIACDGVHVALAHLRHGSVTVRAGQAVTVDTVVGHVGNSGNTSEPHLHIHAARTVDGRDIGVPILFNGTFPVRNTVLVN